MAPVVALERRRGTRIRLDRVNAARLAGAVRCGGVLGPVLLLTALRPTLAGSVSPLLLPSIATLFLSQHAHAHPHWPDIHHRHEH